MEKRKRFLAVAVLAAVLLVMLALYYSRRAGRAEMEIAAAKAAIDDVRATILKQERQAKELAMRERAARVATEQQRKRDRDSMVPPHYRNNPELTHAAYRPLVRKYLAGFRAAAGLSAEQAEAFEVEVATRLGLHWDSFLMAQSISPQHPESAADMEASAVVPVVDAAREMLGDAAAEKLEAVLRARDLRRAVDDLAVYAQLTESPLRADESERLMALMTDAGKTGSEAGRKLTLVALDWERVMRGAAEFLTPVQMKALGTMRAKAMFDREYERITGFPAGPLLPEPER